MPEPSAFVPAPPGPPATATAAHPGWLRGAVLHYREPADGAVEHTRVVVSLVDACPGLALGRGSVVEVEMSEHPADPSRLVDDLIDGNPLIAVPGCGPGSILRFSGCVLPTSSDGPIQAAAFCIETAVTAPAEVLPA